MPEDQTKEQLINDLTELRHRVDELERANRKINDDLRHRTIELKRSYEDMQSISNAASHDLKSPIITIKAFSTIILEDYAEELDDDGKGMFNRVIAAAEKMEHLITDLLAFSRVSTKEVLRTEFNMGILVRGLIEELRPAIGERSVQFKVGHLPAAYGDLHMISRVVKNLLSNAIKFTQPIEKAVVEVGGHTENSENIYYVSDNGTGFDMQLSDRLFGLFQKIHISKDVEGTGTGLVIVKNIVEKHGGRVWADGKMGEGARFYFTLPLKED